MKLFRMWATVLSAIVDSRDFTAGNAIGLLFLASLVWAPPSIASSTSLKTEIQRAKKQVYPALINLSVVKNYYRNGQLSKQRSAGSGVLISSDGYAVTNFHVVDRADEVEGTLSNNATLDARIVGRDPLTDLAVIKFSPEDLPEDLAKFPHAELGDSEELAVGDYVLAMGNPMMMSQSVTLGIVSNTNRVFFSQQGENNLEFGENLQTGLFTEWIQHDASISPGSSGGPLVDLDGTVVGINARGSVTGGDMGFSIPSNQVQSIVSTLIREQRVERSSIGISGRAIKRTNYDSGVVVGSVTEGSPANEADLRPGDRIVAIDGDSITVQYTEELAEFYRRLGNNPAGDTLTLTLRRDGETLRKDLRTERLRDRRGRKATLQAWGFNVQEITQFDRRDTTPDGAVGVRVSSLRSGGPAEDASPPLESGDVIKTFSGDSVAGFDSFIARYRNRTQSGSATRDVLFSVRREGAELYSLLEPESAEEVVDRPRPLGNAWLGVRTQVMTSELRESFQKDLEYGVRVTAIYDNTTADTSDLRVGDVITRIGDRPVEARHDYQTDVFSTMLERMEIGSKVPLTVHRDTVTRTVDVRLETAPLQPDEVSSYKQNRFDFTVREMTFYDRVDYNWPESAEGVMVKSVESGGWAGSAGLQANDLITTVNGEPIDDTNRLRSVFRELIRSKKSTVQLTVRRENEKWYILIEPNWYQESS